jgi:dipeptidyl aminopeptidase/acylaminoacyl peptidase
VRKFLVMAGILALSAASAVHAAPLKPKPDPLIPRVKLFGNPSRIGGRISPDGQWLSWIAPKDGVLNVWAAPVADPTRARALTAETKRPIRSAFWSPDSREIMYVNDSGGDENFKLYAVNPATGAERTLTPFDKTRVELIGTSRKVRDRILIGLNNRDPKWHDVYSLDLASGKLTLVLQNDGYGGFTADEDLNLRLASKPRDDGGTDYFRVTDAKVETTAATTVGMDDALLTQPLGFTTDGKTLYWADSRSGDTSVIEAYDTTSGKMTVVAEDPRADLGEGLFDPKTGEIQAYVDDYLKAEYKPVGSAIAADLAFLSSRHMGRFSVVSRTDADDKWIVEFDPVTAPMSTWLYTRKDHGLKRLFVMRPELEGAPLLPMYPVTVKARDGLTLVSYLTLPRSAGADAAGHPKHAAPMVLLVHGGPWGRDEYGYSGYTQWLANRGYAVLSVNFRASTGFGKAFLNAGNLEWGRKMQNDLSDAVDWAVASGVTRKDKVVIMGGSYGGYATLAGMAFTPDTYACGVDVVGPSNLFTLLQSIPPYWESFRKQFAQRMGDPDTDAGKALLHERSPLFAANAITRPMLIGQGANDPRVNIRESNQIVEALDARKVPVTYIVFPDEGHGFARPENNLAFNAVTESFLKTCLGGRAEPIGEAVRGSTAEVRSGADFVPGLSAALPKRK